MGVEIIETQGNIPEPQKLEAKVPPVVKEEPKYVRLEDLEKVNQAINNTREYNNRQLNDINAKLEKLMPKPALTGDPDLDKLVQEDWQAAVDLKIEKALEKRQVREQAESESQRVARILEESKARVFEKHQELSDPNSAKTKEFLRVIDENPDFRTNPRGPILAMYEMETRLGVNGKLDVGEQKVTRSKASSVPSGSPATKGGYSLSKADMDFCRLNGINPENYKRLKGQREART